jgi:glycogen operon protein
MDFVCQLVRLRRDHPVFRQRAFFLGRPIADGHVKDVAWFKPDGTEMTAADWASPAARSIGMYLSGEGIRTRGPRGERIIDDSFLLWLHGGGEPLVVRLPGAPWAKEYERIVDTAAEPAMTTGPPLHFMPGDPLGVAARSVVLLRAL